MKKVRVTKLVNILLDPNSLIDDPFRWIPKAELAAGSLLHFRFGYGGSDLYMRLFEYEGELYQVRGAPDKVLDDGTVEEFKTYKRRSKIKQEKRARLQIQFYGWLTGSKKGRITLYGRDTEKTSYIDVKLSHKKAQRMLNEAMRRYSLVKGLKPVEENFFENDNKKSNSINPGEQLQKLIDEAYK